MHVRTKGVSSILPMRWKSRAGLFFGTGASRPARVGVLLQSESSIVFRDDFVGKTLNPRWQIIAPDRDRYTLINGEYLLIVTSEKSTNIIQYNDELPDDYEIVIKIQTPPQYLNQAVELLLVKDNENNLYGYRSEPIYF